MLKAMGDNAFVAEDMEALLKINHSYKTAGRLDVVVVYPDGSVMGKGFLEICLNLCVVNNLINKNIRGNFVFHIAF